MEIHHLTKRAPRLPIQPYAASLPHIATMPGCLDWTTRVSDSEVKIGGWLLHPRSDLSSIQVYVNGAHAGAARRTSRPDVARHLSWIPHADRSGFEIRLNPALFAVGAIHHVDLIGYRPITRFERVVGMPRRLLGSDEPFGTPVGRYHTLFRSDLDNFAPTPPAHLMKRVVNNDDVAGFKTGGMKLYADFLQAMAPHRNVASVNRLLDWGCGSGRATVHFLLHQPNIPEVCGCDIDGEAIAWCNDNLAAGQFAHVAPLPRLPYPDAHFDAIVSCSVLSHLKRDMQHLWLAELNRVLAPGGIVLASFHGSYAASVTFPPDHAKVIREAEIYDDLPDDTLGDIVEKGYYNSTFQTRKYTMREFSKHFKMLNYLEAGMHNFQDLVVMEKLGR